jgi:hypothetical protein
MISSPVKTKPRTRTYAVSKDDDMDTGSNIIQLYSN